MPVKIFQGQAEKVEKAMNAWEQTGGERHVAAVVPMPTSDGDVAVMVFYQDAPQKLEGPTARPPQIIVPN